MKIVLLLIPVCTATFGLLVYRLQGTKRQIFKFDLVQFVYLFILAPTMLVWIKSFIFFVLRHEVNLRISLTELFIIDTIFSTLSFILIATLAIHTLTKTFWIRRHHDSDFDVYRLSEYFHLWWSHVAFWVGVMVLFTFVAVVNLIVALPVEATKLQFYGLSSIGLTVGIFLFLAIWMSDAKQGNYMRLMKIFLALFFVGNVGLYFIFDPDFSMERVVFWFVFSVFFGAVFISLFFERYEKTSRLKKLLQHKGWGDNKGVQLFVRKKK